jgi:NAD(P)-dependent dehydrogenase (short-subunit alcohol dehydrogenase family)
MKTVFISGAGRGIGLALAKAFLNQGDRVIATYRSESGLQNLKQLTATEQLQTLSLEVTKSESIASVVQQLDGEPIDVLINNAGVFGGEQQSQLNIDFDEWKQTLAINTVAPIELSLALLPNLKLAGSAKIISISSMMASLERAQPNFYAYRSSKAALNKAMQCLAHDLTAENIVVCPVHPGWVQTDMGGGGADITVEECIGGLVPLIERLTLADTGKFFQYNGEPMAW